MLLIHLLQSQFLSIFFLPWSKKRCVCICTAVACSHNPFKLLCQNGDVDSACCYAFIFVKTNTLHWNKKWWGSSVIASVVIFEDDQNSSTISLKTIIIKKKKSLIPFCIPFLNSISEPGFMWFAKAVLGSLQKQVYICVGPIPKQCLKQLLSVNSHSSAQVC